MRFKLLLIVPMICLPRLVQADNAAVYGYALGDNIIDYPLDGSDVLDADMAAFGGQQIIKVKGARATDVSLTFRLPSRTLEYVEHDWVDRAVAAKTALNLPGIAEFTFGTTRVAEIQAAFGERGFHYACRQLQRVPGGFLTFVSFEIPSRPEAVYTFVLEYSLDLDERGLVDLTNGDFAEAVLVAATVSRPSYPKDFWCSERIAYTAKPELPSIKINETFEDFLPPGVPIVETDPWEVSIEPLLMITKNGAQTWGDRLFIVPTTGDCTMAEIMVWAHTDQEKQLLALKGKEIDGAFNVLMAGQVHGNLRAPLLLNNVLDAPLEGQGLLPFAIGSFVFGPYDFERIVSAEHDPTVFGFSLEFPSGLVGLQNNYWSLEGLLDAGNEAMRVCRESKQ